MLRRLMIAGSGSTVTELTAFDPLAKSPAATLTNLDRRLTANSAVQYATARSVSAASGLVYFSASASRGGGDNWGVGISDVTMSTTTNSSWVGMGNSAGIWREGRVYQSGASIHIAGAAYPDNSEVQIALIVATRRYWMRVNGGTWVGGGDPVTNTTPTGTLPGTGAIHICASLDARGTPNGTVTLPATPALVTGAVPAGFTAGIP